MKRPDSIIILGHTYRITYVPKSADIDRDGREPLWGQINFDTRTIRICDGQERSLYDVRETVFHEMLHGIESEYGLETLQNMPKAEFLVLSKALMDTLVRNGWLKEIE